MQLIHSMGGIREFCKFHNYFIHFRQRCVCDL